MHSETPLISVRGLSRRFPGGETEVTVLRDIDLDIHAGEMVAIIGQSGSGKSTLMNILGCLDRPSGGQYLIDGKNTATMSSSERAALRREHIGFIFQRYHLLSDLKARENVAMPAVYAGMDADARLQRADALLTRLGLSERTKYRPGQLSGGQQQRVSIARALMNGGRIIFADEPTGALDSESGQEVMTILRELHREGHTVILVTHDPQIAASADRIIEIKDGRIIGDTRKRERNPDAPQPAIPNHGRDLLGLGRLASAFAMAVKAIFGHKLRAFLTMLGIIIGIASVVSMVALGQGSQQSVLENISDLGASTINIFPGTFGDRRSFRIRTLTAKDAEVLARQSFVAAATPVIESGATLRIGNRDLTAQIQGVGQQYFQVQNLPIASGRNFSQLDIDNAAALALIDTRNARELFGQENPLGKIILLNNMPAQIIGTIDTSKQNQFAAGNSVNVWMPYSAVGSRLQGRSRVSNLLVRIHDDIDSTIAEDAITRILTRRHGAKDFTLFNNDSIRKTITQTVQTLSLLISAIALISLVVGGIGVMNIMLVSVTERTQEIGIRMAVGARQGDIMRQFLIEAVLLCLIGGLLGIALAFGLGQLLKIINAPFTMIYSTTSIIAAFACSTAIGILFGYLPARRAARLDPVEALTSD